MSEHEPEEPKGRNFWWNKLNEWKRETKENAQTYEKEHPDEVARLKADVKKYIRESSETPNKPPPAPPANKPHG